MAPLAALPPRAIARRARRNLSILWKCGKFTAGNLPGRHGQPDRSSQLRSAGCPPNPTPVTPLPKNVELERVPVGFCRLAPRRNPCLPVTFLSNLCRFSNLPKIRANPKPLATDLLLLPLLNKDWLPGVAGTDPRLGYRFRGVNYEEGGLHRPPFSFLITQTIF